MTNNVLLIVLFCVIASLTHANDATSMEELVRQVEKNHSNSSLQATAAEAVAEASESAVVTDEELEEFRRLIQGDGQRLNFLPELRAFAEDYGGRPLAERLEGVLSDEREKIFIFASRSMPDLELRELMREASDRIDVTVVFRGIFSNESLGKAYGDLQEIILNAKVEEKPPNVIIDPRLFRQFGVQNVPEIVVARGKREIIRARGTYGVDWIETRLSAGQVGDLGAFGNVFAISEPDMLELIKERVANLDFRKIKEGAAKKFWKRQEFVVLNPAKKSRVRKMDPTIVSTFPVMDPDGEVIIPVGTRMNPLYDRPFGWRVMIFNPTRIEEVKFVYDWMKSQPETQRVQLIATEVPRDNGWQAISDLTDFMGRQVQLLNADVRDRFGIEVTPSELYADDNYFYVRETEVAESPS